MSILFSIEPLLLCHFNFFVIRCIAIVAWSILNSRITRAVTNTVQCFDRNINVSAYIPAFLSEIRTKFNCQSYFLMKK